MCVVESVGVFLDIEGCTYVKSKFIFMGIRSYVGRLKMRTHEKVGVDNVILWWLE